MAYNNVIMNQFEKISNKILACIFEVSFVYYLALILNFI